MLNTRTLLKQKRNIHCVPKSSTPNSWHTFVNS